MSPTIISRRCIPIQLFVAKVSSKLMGICRTLIIRCSQPRTPCDQGHVAIGTVVTASSITQVRPCVIMMLVPLACSWRRIANLYLVEIFGIYYILEFSKHWFFWKHLFQCHGLWLGQFSSPDSFQHIRMVKARSRWSPDTFQWKIPSFLILILVSLYIQLP